jgi:hypothetical protein
LPPGGCGTCDGVLVCAGCGVVGLVIGPACVELFCDASELPVLSVALQPSHGWAVVDVEPDELPMAVLVAGPIAKAAVLSSDAENPRTRIVLIMLRLRISPRLGADSRGNNVRADYIKDRIRRGGIQSCRAWFPKIRP